MIREVGVVGCIVQSIQSDLLHLRPVVNTTLTAPELKSTGLRNCLALAVLPIMPQLFSDNHGLMDGTQAVQACCQRDESSPTVNAVSRNRY